MRFISTLLLSLSTLGVLAQTTCVDPLACNFTEFGECEFLDDNGFPCVTEGCAITGACNFDPEADINDGSCEFTSCLGCTDEAACNYDSEAVYLDLSCIYFVDCNGVCGGDWIEDECGNCYAPNTVITPDSLFYRDWFQPIIPLLSPGIGVEVVDFLYMTGGAGASPYLNTGIINLPVDCDFLYIQATGGCGAGWSTSCNLDQGGLSASIRALVVSDSMESINVLVGNCGSLSNCPRTGGGGGATAVFNGEDPIVIAGGGGGNGDDCISSENSFASLMQLGNPGGFCSGLGVVGYAGPQGGSPGSGVGGGLFSVRENAADGQGLLEGALGGVTDFSEGAEGGFGGGGAPVCGFGGGGGYSGGGAPCNDDGAGGGGSFLNEALWAQADLTYTWTAFGDLDFPAPVGILKIKTIRLTNSTPSCELGCMAEAACNFNLEATNDDGSCDFCFCGPGTEYSIDEGQCLVVGGGSDINGDGCTNLNDLLDLLAGYGSCID